MSTGVRRSHHIRRMLAISTGHLSGPTRTWMDLAATGRVVGHTYIEPHKEYGWFVHTQTARLVGAMPADLEDVILHAHNNSCVWVLFDRDINRNEGLTWYGDE